VRRTVAGPLLILALTIPSPVAAIAAPRAAAGHQSPQTQSQKPARTPPEPDARQGDRTRLDKDKLTPAQRKLQSPLRDEIARRRDHAVLPLRAGLRRIDIDNRDRVLVEIRARLLSQLQRKIERLKGTVVSSSIEHRSLIARVPILKLEALAEEATVSAIGPAPTSTTVRPQRR
jgi:hypothetical protein